MTLVSFFTGLFAVAEAVPVIRDAFHAAIGLYYAKKIEAANKERSDGIKDLEKAKSLEDIQSALGRIVRNRAQ